MKPIRYAYLLLALALVPALAGCGDDKKDAENKQKVENLLAKIPGSHNATVMVTGDTLIITNFKAQIPYQGMGVNDLSIAEVKAEGVDFEAAAKPGVVPVAGKISFKDYRSTVTMSADTGMGEGAFNGTVDMMDFGNLRMDAAAMDKALTREGGISMQEMGAAAMTFKADSSSMLNYRGDFNLGMIAASFSIEKAASGAFSITECKDASMENFKIVILGSEMFDLGKLGVKSVSLPDLFTPALKMAGVEDPIMAMETYQEELGAAFKKNPLVMRGLVVENLKLRPLTNDAVTLKKSAVDLEFSLDRIVVKKNVEGLVIPPSVYGKGFEGKTLAAVYGKPFEFDGAFDFETAKDGEGGRLVINAARLTEKNLGSADFTLKAGFAKGDADIPAVPANPNATQINGMTLALKDTGGVDLAFTVRAEELKRYDPTATKESLRAETIDAVTQSTAGGARQKIAEAFVKFLNGSGSFTLSIAPTFPVTLEDLASVMGGSGEGLNLQVSGDK